MTAHSNSSVSGFKIPGRLPRGIRWSAATAAFQIEGARNEGARARSIWDDFADTPGAVLDGSSADPGPDSYHRYLEDVALVRALGLDRYRFSISWVRVMGEPFTSGSANPAGLDYYDRLVDALLEAGVTPFPTLYHWDLPAVLEANGGWHNRDTAFRFADYAATVANHLGDRVKNWFTLNEPAMTTLEGYAVGSLAPGKTELFGALPTVHHQLLAHGLAMPILREVGATEVGLTNNHTKVLPLEQTEADFMAAGLYDAVHNGMFADPLLLGTYPDLSSFGLPDMPIQDGDMELISSPTDFYGINFYNPSTVTAAGEDSPIPFDLVPTPGAPTTGFGEMWPIVPEALTALLLDFKERYGKTLPPIVIAENGAAFPEPGGAQRIEDGDRIGYISAHIEAVAAAVDAGVDVCEYTVWSLLDNWEWADGFTQRFGLTHVDMETGERTPKASFDWYRDLIASTRS